MFKTLLAATAAAALFATPALAQTANFVGPRVELNAGVLDLDTDNVDYGAALGYDVAVAPRTTLGAELNTSNTFDDNAREFGAAARLGYAVNPNVLLYGKAGYNRLALDHTKDLDGLTVGAGAELALTRNVYTGAEYRYTNFDRGYDRHGVGIKLGVRF